MTGSDAIDEIDVASRTTHEDQIGPALPLRRRAEHFVLVGSQ